MKKEVSAKEHQQIYNILEQEEIKLNNQFSINDDRILALDEKCKQIFQNWQTTYPPLQDNFQNLGTNSSSFASDDDFNISREPQKNKSVTSNSCIEADNYLNMTNKFSPNFESADLINNNIQTTPESLSEEKGQYYDSLNKEKDISSQKSNNIHEENVEFLKNDLENLMTQIRSVSKNNHVQTNSFMKKNYQNSINKPIFCCENEVLPLNHTNEQDHDIISDKINGQKDIEQHLSEYDQLRQENIRIKTQLIQVTKELEAEKAENENLRISLKKSEELRQYYRRQAEILHSQKTCV